MDERDIIAKNITLYRKKLGLSQLELAEKIQYSNKNISKWENGEAIPNIFTLKQLANVFNITVDQLVTNQEAIIIDTEKEKPQRKRLIFSKLLWLLLSNAILLVCACITIYIFSILQITCFNKWLFLIYILPLSALSVFIFVACVKNKVDILSISIAGWLTALSLYATLQHVDGIGYIFLLMCGLQVLLLMMMLVINHHIKFKSRKQKD